jgi:cell wall assembly regulator SMI1
LTDGLAPALQHLYDVLDRLKVSAVSALQPGLAGEAIERVLSRIPHTAPPELVALYRWRNGAGTISANSQLFPGGTFLPLADAVRAYQQLVEGATAATRDTEVELTEVYDPRWFPIFVDSAGNPHVMTLGQDAGAGSIWYVPIEDATDRQLAAQNLRDFVDVVVSRWENGAYYLDKATGIPCQSWSKLAAERRAADKPQVDVSVLVKDLAATDALSRARSLRLLKEFLFPEAVEPLVALLNHPSPNVRRDAASLLGQIGDPKAIPALVSARRDRDGAVREGIEWALRELGKG